MVKKNILGTIGGTPMVRINRLCPNPNVNIYAKLEGFNPTGSIKDRIALRMIEEAEQDGRLTPGKTIIEPTSGNTGIGLAIVGIVKGYPVEIVMSSAVSVERRKIIRSYGAKVILTPAEEGTDGAIRLARSKVAGDPDKYFMPDQFANAGNYLAHYQSTALEIWQQTGGRIDYLVCAIGTSGTLMGLSRFLKVMKPDIRVVCAQPIRGHYIQGLKNMEEAIVPDIYDPSQIDMQEMVESEEAIAMARRIRDVQVLGVDLSEQMLAVARRKIEARGLDGRIVLDRGDAERLAVADASVDVATVAFGVRNFGDLGAGLRELARTIKPGGKVVILEFSRPRNRVFRALYEFYSYKILPRIGGLVSRDKRAYEYLPASVGEFPAPEEFMAMMARAGFRNCRARSQSFGIAQIYIGER